MKGALRILYVDTESVWRGGQEQLLSLMVGMAKRGHEVWLAAPRGCPLSRKAWEQNLFVRPFRQRSEFSPAAFLRIRQILGEAPFDGVHFNTPRPLLMGGLACLLKNIPIRVCSRRVNFPLRSFLSRGKYNWFLNRVITVSESIRETLVEGGVDPDLIEVIYEGVDLNWIDGLAPPDGPRPRGLVVGTVAHLSPEKGHGTILEAACRLRPGNPGVRYVFVGEGDLKSSLTRQAQELGLERSVIFTGFRSDSEAMMKRFDIFCLPSLSEGLSSAILAAMASRLPVVATQVGGIPELVIHEQTGFLIPPQDPVSLAAALQKLFDSEGLRRQMGERGRARVENHFALEAKINSTETLYHELRRSPQFS